MSDAPRPGFFQRLVDLFNRIRNDKTIAKILSVVSYLYPLVLLYLSWEEIKTIDWQGFALVFLYSLLLYYVSMFLQNVDWSLILEGNLRHFHENSEIYFKTVLMKRLPGGFWHWLGRTNLYQSSNSGVTPGRISSSNLFEWLILILSGLSCYVLARSLPLGLAALGVTYLVGLLILKKSPQRSELNYWSLLLMLVIYVVCWFLGAAILYMLLSNVSAEAGITFPLALSAWALSSAFGMLVFILPSGAIIRDLSLTALLSAALEPSKVFLVALQIRIIFIVADILWATLSLQLLKIVKKSDPTAN